MMTYDFELTGLTPLLMHADSIEAADELEKFRKDPSNKKNGKAGDDRSPAWSYQGYIYGDGTHVCMPSDNLMAAIRKAAAEITLKKQKTFKAMSQSGMMVEQEFMEFRAKGKQIALADLPSRDRSFSEHVEACQALGFRLWMKRAAVGQAKHIRVRPRFESWSVKGTMLVTNDAITREVLDQMLTIAGRQVGLCDWRPGCKTPGPFGQFSVTLK